MTQQMTDDVTQQATDDVTQQATEEMVTSTQITSERGTLGQSTTAVRSPQTKEETTESPQDATDPVTDMSEGTTYQRQTSKLATDHNSQNQTSDYYGTTDSFSRWPATAGGTNDPVTSDGLVNFETTHPEYTSEHNTGDGGSSSFVTRRQRTTVHSEERRTYPYSGGFTGSESIATDSSDEIESIATGSTDETESITTDSIKDETESIATDESRDIMTSSAETVTMFTSGSNPLSGWSEWTTCSEPCGTGECVCIC
eukprot:sb/3468584/